MLEHALPTGHKSTKDGHKSGDNYWGVSAGLCPCAGHGSILAVDLQCHSSTGATGINFQPRQDGPIKEGGRSESRSALSRN